MLEQRADSPTALAAGAGGAADAIIVMGTAVIAERTLGPSLQTRFDTALRLFSEGVAPTLCFSGGNTWGALNEAEVMRTVALERGVPASAIVIDPLGRNTRQSAIECAQLARQHGWTRVVVVSHWYHLPRCRMTLEQEGFAGVLTVPAEGRAASVRNLVRECVAWWAYLGRLR